MHATRSHKQQRDIRWLGIQLHTNLCYARVYLSCSVLNKNSSCSRSSRRHGINQIRVGAAGASKQASKQGRCGRKCPNNETGSHGSSVRLEGRSSCNQLLRHGPP